MQLLNYQIPINPLKILDDYLISISTKHSQNNRVDDDTDIPSDSEQEQDAALANSTIPASSSSSEEHQTTREAEQLHNSVLRVASELFSNNISLLENSLALLEEQEQYQNNNNNNNNNDNQQNNSSSTTTIIPPIRTIRARRSGRVALLVRKQRKKSRTSNQNQSDDDYYLCLLGRDRVIIDDNNAFQTSEGTYLCTPHHRIGMHCTCRSFFHNIKGSGSALDGGRSPSGKGAYRSSSSSSSGTNSIVCKHLLAVILMPHLLPWRSQGVEEDVVDDKVFTKLVMRASIG